MPFLHRIVNRRLLLRFTAVLLLLGATETGAFFYLRHRANGAVQGLSFPRLAPLPRTASILIIAPHCDDETLGAGGLIRQATRAGARVRVSVQWREAHDPADLGFPGGHVINATVIATVCAVAALSLLRTRWQKALGLGVGVTFVAGTFTSRIYESAHFLTDNLAGLAMGLSWAAVAIPVTRWMFPEVRNAPAQPEPGLFLK